MTNITESDVEVAAFEWFDGLGWLTLYGSEIAPGAERDGYGRLCWSRCFQFRTCVL